MLIEVSLHDALVQVPNYVIESKRLCHLQVEKSIVGTFEVFCSQSGVDLLDFAWRRPSGDLIDVSGRYLSVSHRTTLEDVQHFSHVTSCESDNCSGSLIIKQDFFAFAHLIEFDGHALIIEWSEAEARAPRLQGWDNLGDIVANQAEPGSLRVLFDN